MTAPTTPAGDEARAQVLAMLCVNDDGNVHDWDIDEAERRIDALIAAVRAAVLTEVEERVKGMRLDISGMDYWIRRDHQSTDTARYDKAESRNATLDDLLAALSTLRGA